MTTSASLAELRAAGIRFRPAEAVTLVREVCRQYAVGTLPGIPSPPVIRLSSDGELLIQGPAIDEAPVARAAHLLQSLLCDEGSPAEYRAGGPLRLVIARALGTIDLPAFSSAGDFAAALARFSTLEVRDTVGAIMQAWQIANRAAATSTAARADLTISDIRRARRATGMTLDEVAVAAGVTPPQIRYLEWGCPRGWRADAAGRDALVRYAHAAGLDDALVTSIAWPLLEAGTPVAAHPEPAAAPAEPVPVEELLPSDRRTSWFAVPVAVAALAVSAAAGYVWGSLQVPPPPQQLEAPPPAAVLVDPPVTTASQQVGFSGRPTSKPKIKSSGR